MRPRRRRILLYAAGAAAAICAAFLVALPGLFRPRGGVPRAEALLRATLGGARTRAQRAAEEVKALAKRNDLDRRTLFRRAMEVVDRDGVDGVVVVDRKGRARFWAGRTFDTSMEEDFPRALRGYSTVDVLDRPAHRVLYAALPVGDEVALAFSVIEERFPRSGDLAGRIARETGLKRIDLRFGQASVPLPPRNDARVHSAVIEGLVHATFYERSKKEREQHAAAILHLRLAILGALLALAAALLLWRRWGRRLSEGSLSRLAWAAGLVAGVRVLFALLELPPGPLFEEAPSASSLWASPGDALLTAFAAIWIAVLIVRTAHSGGRRARAGLLGGVTTAGLFFLPPYYVSLLSRLPEGRAAVGLFDPIRVLPSPDATLLLGAACLLTGAVIVLALAAERALASVRRPLAVLPYLALAGGGLPWHGPLLAVGCALASLSLRGAGTRPERAAAFTFLSALISLPVLFESGETVRLREIAQRARALVSPGEKEQVRTLLEASAENASDPEHGMDRAIAAQIAQGADPSRFAFQLWSSAGWNWSSGEACAVEIWTPDGSRLLSSFDLDSPPLKWLPPAPDRDRTGFLEVHGRGEGASVRFYVFDLPLRTLGDGRTVALARFAVPDRWDALVANLRPSIFTEPLQALGTQASPPLLLAELDASGRPVRTSDGTTTSLQPLSPAVMEAARREGHATEQVAYRGQPGLALAVPFAHGFAVIVLEEAYLQRGGLAFAKVLLVDSGLCLLYWLGLLLFAGAKPVLLFRHRVALVLVALSIPPVVLLAYSNRKTAERSYEAEVAERLQRPLDTAETLLRTQKRETPPDDAWCMNFAADHRADINAYRGPRLIATSRPGVWDTGLLARRMSAEPYVALYLEGRDDYTGKEFFGRPAGLREAYRKIEGKWGQPPVVLAAPALDNRRALERRAASGYALVLGAYLLTATIMLFAALFLARSLTRPLQRLRAATSRLAAGDLEATLPENRRDEFGDLIRAFNQMTRELKDVQDLRVRAEKEAAWREMARQVAHEIKNPLTPMKLTVQNLLAAREEDPEAFEKDFHAGMQRILDQIEALRRISGEFSAYARFPTRRPQPLDCNAVLKEVADLYTGSGELEMVFEPAPQPLRIQADKDEIRRALINLVTNARQAGATRVLLRALHEDRYARIDAVDNGAGIEPELLTHIFEPSFTTKTRGTGLGLPIVKRIVDDHKGTIVIDSEPGKGTRVTVRFPKS